MSRPRARSSAIAARRLSFISALALPLAALGGCSKKDAPSGSSAAASSKPVGTAAAVALPPLPVPPAIFGALKTPENNPTTAEKVHLGNQLFFDQRLSVDGSRSCYSCHQNEDGTGGHDPKAIGAGNKPLPRHSPTLWNVAYLPKLYWDGRSDSLEAQAKAAWSGGNMGVPPDKLAAKADELGSLPEYKEQFDRAFPGLGATPETVVQAISAYERTLFCADTAFDRFSAGDTGAMNDAQKAGWELFIGKAGCHGCHTPPLLSDAYVNADGAYHNNGVGQEGKDEASIDEGRMKISKNPLDWAAFKTPSLRNITRSAPYFHDGSVAKLEDAVRFMATGGFMNKALDPKLMDKKLTDEELKNLIAFLGALECGGKLTPPAR
jgi:cytochrome c peroxidase